MTVALVIVGLALLIGGCIGLFVYAVTYKDQYGHPDNSVKDLRASLPKLPGTYQWQSWVETKQGRSYFRAKIVDVSDYATHPFDKVPAVAEVKACLSHRDGYFADELWANHYGRYWGIRGSIYRDEVLYPFRNRASAAASKVKAETVTVTDFKFGDV